MGVDKTPNKRHQEAKIKIQKKLELHANGVNVMSPNMGRSKMNSRRGEKYEIFLNLEESRVENNTINRLVKRDGEIVTEDSEVIKKITNYYEELYT